MDDEQILARGGTERDIEEIAKANGADLEKEDLECEFCGGTGEVTVDEYVYPGEPHTAPIGSKHCICTLGDDSDDMDDDFS